MRMRMQAGLIRRGIGLGLHRENRPDTEIVDQGRGGESGNINRLAQNHQFLAGVAKWDSGPSGKIVSLSFLLS